MHGIQSIGPPPERHADRVVGAMLRQLAQTRAHLLPAIYRAFDTSSDGTPRAQRKMEARIKQAGALVTKLYPGKRGRYVLKFVDCTGWDQVRDAEITIDDLDTIPEKPWIAYHLNTITSVGGGRHECKANGGPFLFVTHHALSRLAQRENARTAGDLLIAAESIMMVTAAVAKERGWDNVLAAPERGWRVPVTKDGDLVVVLKRHEKRKALVAATLFKPGSLTI